MSYTKLSTALAALKNLPAVRGLPTTDDEQFLNSLLSASAGKDAKSQTIYRIYFVAAKYLQQPRSLHQLESAEGAKFTGLATPIASLLSLQAAEDLALGLTVPPGMEATIPEIKGVFDKPAFQSRRYGTTSVRINATP